MPMTKISASILNADLAHLSDVAATAQTAGADFIHYDVMDGIFVDNLSFGLPVLQCLKKYAELPIDAHLMIQEPHRFVSRFAEAGAEMLSFHIESSSDTADTIRLIHENGMKAGIAVSPDTPVSDVFPYLSMLQDDDFVLLMTVHPGYGKQKFLDYVLDKIKELRAEMNAKQLNLHIQVDGGIQAETAKLCREAGADNLVSGSYLFCSESPAEAVRSLR